MKKDLICSIVQDLLPNYIEKLTSENTKQAIAQHLDTCEDCKKVYEQMVADIGTPEKVPARELKFLKKINRTRQLAAVLCVVLTLLLSYLIYTSEYKFTSDKRDLAAAITEYTSSSKTPVDAYVLETQEIDGVLVASFKDQANAGVYGIAEFLKGFNQRYRIVRTKIKSSNYSAVVQIYPVEIKNERYIAVSGYNLSDEIKYYGLDYYAYTKPGYLAEDRIRKSLKFEIKNPQFLEFYHVEDLHNLLEDSAEETLYNYHLVATSMYDANGMEITENYRNVEDADRRVSSGSGKAELFLLYVFIAIVIGVGYIMTRYFLTA